MSEEALSYNQAFDQIYFETIGSRTIGDYTITLFSPGKDPIPLKSIKGNKSNGLKEARIVISKYILEHMNGNKNTIFNQHCISPERPSKDDKWNQWKVSQFI